MFDSHTYPKGGDVLHTLRRFMGDEAFFAGLRHYLNTYQHTPVQAAQLERVARAGERHQRRAVLRPVVPQAGPPRPRVRLEDGRTATVVVTIKQTQDTERRHADLPRPERDARRGRRRTADRKVPFVLDGKEQTVTIPAAASPTAVVLDPDHDFLRVVSAASPPTDRRRRTSRSCKAVADPGRSGRRDGRPRRLRHARGARRRRRRRAARTGASSPAFREPRPPSAT